jgi:hypothetical protein
VRFVSGYPFLLPCLAFRVASVLRAPKAASRSISFVGPFDAPAPVLEWCVRSNVSTPYRASLVDMAAHIRSESSEGDWLFFGDRIS